jgi:hypothetical protein
MSSGARLSRSPASSGEPAHVPDAVRHILLVGASFTVDRSNHTRKSRCNSNGASAIRCNYAARALTIDRRLRVKKPTTFSPESARTIKPDGTRAMGNPHGGRVRGVAGYGQTTCYDAEGNEIRCDSGNGNDVFWCSALAYCEVSSAAVLLLGSDLLRFDSRSGRGRPVGRVEPRRARHPHVD